MTWWEILIVIAAAGFVAAVIAFSIRRKMQGRSSCGECGGCCASCSGCKHLPPKKQDQGTRHTQEKD